MSATDEELDAVHDIEMDHVTYVLGMYRYVACPLPVSCVRSPSIVTKPGVLAVPFHALPVPPVCDLGEERGRIDGHPQYRVFCTA